MAPLTLRHTNGTKNDEVIGPPCQFTPHFKPPKRPRRYVFNP